MYRPLSQPLAMILFGVIFLSSCTPKTAEKLEEKDDDTQVEVIVEEVKDRLTHCITFDDIEDGYRREEIETAFVLYRDQMKLGDLKSAYPIWQKAMHGAPGSNGRVQYHFEDGLRIFKHFYDTSPSIEEKRKWLDSVEWVYNKRVECFGDEAYIAGRMAFDYYYYYNELIDQDSIYPLFKKAVDGKGEKTDYFVVNPFVKILNERYVDSLIDVDEARHYAYIMNDALEYGPNNCKGSECQAWTIILEYAPNILDNFEGIEGFYDCDYYARKYYKIFLDNKEDCEIVHKAYRRMRWGDCDESRMELMQVKHIVDTDCYVAPPAPGPLKSAYLAYNDGKYREAIDNFKIFIETSDDPALKAKYNLLISKIYYGDIRNFPESRKYALKAASHKANWGEPYILIGKLYASSGPICGPGRGWDSQIVTWVAIDKFIYAKSIDPSVSEEANKLIWEYSKYMPSKEDIFSRLHKEGDSFVVPCWIQERTTIRAAKK